MRFIYREAIVFLFDGCGKAHYTIKATAFVSQLEIQLQHKYIKQHIYNEHTKWIIYK